MDRLREEKDLQKRIERARRAQIIDDKLLSAPEQPQDVSNIEDFNLELGTTEVMEDKKPKSIF